ncbi:hypothetical protein [Micromonospora sp. NPDC005087]
MRRGEQPPWIVPDGLWQHIERLLPKRGRYQGYPGRVVQPVSEPDLRQ